ncbi:hypothetical protein GP486_001487 [Trichoglossum hirsutum]|uniref:Uncharacterized protein n=1 Tax=Trichoglossum hirsutum TaxID=265104 RepID=A0A9P8LH25_9PEZI|nr:hypothetical protein GP486_001487 [Trichoglossum hirsutum]
MTATTPTISNPSSSNSLIPLTTHFDPPLSCLQHLTLSFVPSPSPSSTITGKTVQPAFADRRECFPSGFLASVYYGPANYYSPGLCPIGYTSACEPTLPASVNGVKSGESAWQCCPSTYTCDPYSYNICNSALNSRVTITVAPDGETVNQWQTITLPNANGDYSLYGERLTVANAPAVMIRFQSSDLPFLSNAATEPLASTTILSLTTDSTNILNATQSSNPTITNASSPRELSQGVKIALAIAIPTSIILFLAGIFIGFRWRELRQRRVSITDSTLETPNELKANSMSNGEGPPWLLASRGSRGGVAEIATWRPVHEVE